MRCLLAACVLLLCGAARAEEPATRKTHADIHSALKKQWERSIQPFTITDIDLKERASLRKLPLPPGENLYVSGSLTGDRPFDDGCVIREIDGRKMTDARRLKETMAAFQPGQTVKLEVLVFRNSTSKPRKPNRWEREKTEITIHGVWEFIESQVERRTDPADQSDWIEPKGAPLHPLQLSVHRKPGVKVPRLVLRLTETGENEVSPDRFKISFDTEAFEIRARKGNTVRGRRDGVATETAEFDISEWPDLIDVFLESKLEGRNTVRFFRNEVDDVALIDPEHLLANRAIIHAYYAERLGR